jgi:REP element-mobilizing transposase RayT
MGNNACVLDSLLRQFEMLMADTFAPLIGPIRLRRRGYLPHLEASQATYFVTFRTNDSLPQGVVADLRRKKQRLGAQAAVRSLLPVEAVKLKRLSTRKMESLLDEAHGSCPMLRAEAAQIVANVLMHDDGREYRLFSWVVMPNHVHVVFSPIPPQSLSMTVTTWKSVTAHRLDSFLNRTGTFWQREYFDRLLRDQAEFERAVEYVFGNPVAAGLHNWRWVWKKSDA